VLAKAPLASEAASAWAQGGIAAAVGADDDPSLHAADTIAAGAGLCDALVVERITAAAPGAVEDLARWGVAFDCSADGRFKLGLEAAHGRRRIVHAGGDGTGREILRALIASALRTPSITVLEGVEARRLMMADGKLAGVLARTKAGPLLLPSSRVVIATGGVGGLYQHTTNPLGAIGQGLALAARAGAVLTDMEFVQFHPTALDVGRDPMPLVSEAVRGEGATLIDEAGERFMAGHGGDELEPRDIVTRAVWGISQRASRVSRCARRRSVCTLPRGFRSSARTATRPAPILPPHPSRCDRRRYHMVASPWMRQGAPRSRECGPAARQPPRACTEPTASPATRCSRLLAARAGLQRASPARRDGAE
jgi:L-aspartate oxidase